MLDLCIVVTIVFPLLRRRQPAEFSYLKNCADAHPPRAGMAGVGQPDIRQVNLRGSL